MFLDTEAAFPYCNWSIKMARIIWFGSTSVDIGPSYKNNWQRLGRLPKGLNFLFILTDNSILKQTSIPCSCARSCLFLSDHFRALCKYKAKVAMGAMEGTVQEGSIPIWMEVVFFTKFFLVKSFPNMFQQIFI